MDNNRKRELEVKERNKALTDLDKKELDLLRKLEDVITQQTHAQITAKEEADKAAVEAQAEPVQEESVEEEKQPEETTEEKKDEEK